MGIPLDQMSVWNPREDAGGLSEEDMRQARLFLWKGHCSVHLRFSPQHVERARRAHPGIRVIAHPECSWEVCQAADEVGSTEYIVKRVVESPPGSQWAVGTEIHLVNRLAAEHPDRMIVLSTTACACAAPCIEFRRSTFAGRWKIWSAERLLTKSRWTRKLNAGRVWRSTACWKSEGQSTVESRKSRVDRPNRRAGNCRLWSVDFLLAVEENSRQLAPAVV